MVPGFAVAAGEKGIVLFGMGTQAASASSPEYISATLAVLLGFASDISVKLLLAFDPVFLAILNIPVFLGNIQMRIVVEVVYFCAD